LPRSSPDIRGHERRSVATSRGRNHLIPDGDAYVARAEFMPLALLADIKTTPSEFSPGRALSKCSCTGAQRGLNTAISLRFERRVVA